MGILEKIFKKKKVAKIQTNEEDGKEAEKPRNTMVYYDKQIVDSMDGFSFEKYCVKLLRAYGFQNVRQTKLSGDYGVDILAKINDDYIAIQCKRYSTPIGIKAVQEIVSGREYYGCNRSMIITNQKLTEQAIRLAQRTNTTVVRVEELVRQVNLNSRYITSKVFFSDEGLKKMARDIIEEFRRVNIIIKMDAVEVRENEIVYVIEKLAETRLSVIKSAKNEVIFNLGIVFDIMVNYEKSNISLTFSKNDVAEWMEKRYPEEISVDQKVYAIDSENSKQNPLDDYFVDAAINVIEKNRASIGNLQKDLKIGFNRAAYIMDQLCEAGVVSEENGILPRKVLMTGKEFESYLNNYYNGN